MKKQNITIHNAGNQESTVDIILHLAELGFHVKCAMAELASSIEAEREFAEYSEPDDDPVVH